MVRYCVGIKGIVQGVGFRPFCFGLAKALALAGFVRNTSEGVTVEIEGSRADCDAFVSRLKESPPPMTHIDKIVVSEKPPKGESDFLILPSVGGAPNTLISPDIGICGDCAEDITAKVNRRFKYAFTNCTNCGPRFTIVNGVPYDRKNTSMAVFPMCPDCQREYDDPSDRRFHAQPNACPVCGPGISFIEGGKNVSGDAYDLFNKAIDSGKIIALKGIGGYHLACDALNEEAVKRLREKKLRYDKPFAVMMRDIETVRKYCKLSAAEETLITSPVKPIVLIKKKENSDLAPSTAPLNSRLGVMLPYTPLHLIIMQAHEVLVMTSGNFSDQPMIFDDDEALIKLPHVADAILTHNRRIVRRMDDSVAIVINEKPRIIRRARGYVPEPLLLSGNKKNILAVGAQQKNTFCLAKGENAFLSGHIGDLDDEDTAKCLENEIDSFILIFDALPEAVACDKHPDYISTALARNFGLPIYEIQHHHAHFASALAEHNVTGNAIGLIFDGTGYGDDGCIWGGEALYGDIGSSARMGHLKYFPLIGGEAAIREPWRAALAVADMASGREAALSLFPEYSEKSGILLLAGEKKLNSPLTSSMGRLFDAVAALAGIRKSTTYEGQAAVDLQQSIDKSADGAYRFNITEENGSLIFDWQPLIREILSDIKSDVPAGTISLRFHRAVIDLIVSAALKIRDKTECDTVVLSGGVFQNDYLLEAAETELSQKGFKVYTNEKIPVNDGGISFGQAAAASYKMR